MSRLQVARLALASLGLAAIQIAGFDRFLLFGVAYLALPLFLAVAVGGRLPFTNAALTGAMIGVTWDLLSIDLFGRYALALALVSAAASIVMFGRGEARGVQTARRAIAVALGIVLLAVVSALAGETLPELNTATGLGYAVSILFGTLGSGTILKRLALPTRTIWDSAEDRPTAWADRRAGLYSIPADVAEREAA